MATIAMVATAGKMKINTVDNDSSLADDSALSVIVGDEVGDPVGDVVGAPVGDVVGAPVGDVVGGVEGAPVG